MPSTLQGFDIHVVAVGPSSGRFHRFNREVPMPSPRASEALDAAVEEVKATLAAHGFTVVRTGYGVRGIKEINDEGSTT